MTKRDAAWAFGGFWACMVIMVFAMWWTDQKTGVPSVEPPASLQDTMGQIEQVAETYQQLKATNQIAEDVSMKKWAVFERRLNTLEMQLAAQMAMLEKYKGQHDVMVAGATQGKTFVRLKMDKPGGNDAAPVSLPADNTGGSQGTTHQGRDILPAHHLVRLAKEVGFTTIRVQP